MKTIKSCAFLLFTTWTCTVAVSLAFAQSSFYEGQTITIIEGREPGGTGAMRVQAALPFLKKYIPGQPTIVVQFMPGAAWGRVGVFPLAAQFDRTPT